MKKLYWILLILAVFSCQLKRKNTRISNAKQLTDNAELLEIYKNDQADRKADNINWSIVSKRDSSRQKRIFEILEQNKIQTSNDYHNAAMIFQHGTDSTAYGMAVKLMRKSIDLDSNANKWLLAAAIDRYLLSKNEPQIYGTQFEKHGLDADWIFSIIDTTKISEAERIKYGVGTLSQQREKVKMMNKKKN